MNLLTIIDRDGAVTLRQAVERLMAGTRLDYDQRRALGRGIDKVLRDAVVVDEERVTIAPEPVEAAETGPIPDYIRQRFAVMRTASDFGDLCVRSMLRTSDGAQAYVVCAVNREDDGSASFVPLGEINASDDPYSDYKE